MTAPHVELLALAQDWPRLRALPTDDLETAFQRFDACFNACFDSLENATYRTRERYAMEWLLERNENTILHAETLHRAARIIDADWKAHGGNPRPYAKRIAAAVGMRALQIEWDFADSPPSLRPSWFFNAVKNHKPQHEAYVTRMAIQHDWARDSLLRIYMRGNPANYPWMEPLLTSTPHAPSNAVLGVLIAAQAELIPSPSPWQDIIQKWYPEWASQALKVLAIDDAVQGPIQRWSEIEARENHIAAILGTVHDAPTLSDLPDLII